MQRPKVWIATLVGLAAAGALVTSMLDGQESEVLGTVLVEDDEVQARPSFAVLPDGSLLNLDVAVSGAQVDATLSLQPMAAPSRSVLFALDISGSTLGEGEGCGGDFNGDGLTDTILDCELAATLQAIEEVGAFGSVAEVGIVPFYLIGQAADVQPDSGIQIFTAPLADLDQDAVLDVETVLRSAGKIGLFSWGVSEFSNVSVLFGSTGRTLFDLALEGVCEALPAASQPERIVLFLSDGQSDAGQHVSTQLPCAEAVTIHTVAVGPDSACDFDPNNLGSLNDIASLSGGTCTHIETPSGLADLLGATLIPSITKVEISVDGGPPVDVSSDVLPGLPHRGGGELTLSHVLDQPTFDICVTVTAADTTLTECFLDFYNFPPVADAGPDQQVTEGDLVVLDGSASVDPEGNPLSYSWRLLSQDGPPLVLSGDVLPTAALQTLDDGTYTFELAVDDGEDIATDTVTIEVVNAPPAATGYLAGAATGGVTLVTLQHTDAGVIDTHTATIDWGDGTIETIDAAAQGTGWGSFVGGHVYATAGSYAVSVEISDDDGDASVVPLSAVEVSAPTGIWARGTSGWAVDWTGGSGTMQGHVHSNAGIRFTGSGKEISGPVEYVTTAKVTGQVVVDPPPVQVGVQDAPFDYALADYRPGGAAALLAGADFHDISSACQGGTWQPTGPLAPGLYYADCDVHFVASALDGTITVAAEGEIQVSGSGAAFVPYSEGLLFLAGEDVQISGSGSSFLGNLVSENGTIDVAGSGTRLMCGLLAEAIDLSGSGLDIGTGDCVRSEPTKAPPLLVPELSVALTNDVTDPLPGQAVTSTVRVENGSALLMVPGFVGMDNHGATDVTLAAVEVALEVQDATTLAWTELPTTSTGLPAVGDVLPADTLSSWGMSLVASLDAVEVARILDPTQVSAVRTRVALTVDDPTAPVRPMYRFDDDLVGALQAQAALVTDLQVTLTGLDGQTQILPAGDLDVGELVEVATVAGTPVPEPIGPTETADAYVGRLLDLDGTGLGALAMARGIAGIGPILGPQQLTRSTLRVPAITTTASVPAQVDGGTDLPVDLSLTNPSGATAAAVSATVDGVAGLDTTLVSGEVAATTVDVPVPLASAGTTYDFDTVVSWQDDLGGSYGPMVLPGSTFVDLPPALSADVVGALSVDADGNGVPSAGDTLAWTLTVRNQGSSGSGFLVVEVVHDAANTYVPGSASTTNGFLLQDAPSTIAYFGSIPGFGTGTVSFSAVVGDVPSVTVVGYVTGLDPVQATTSLAVPQLELVATMGDVLQIDADGDGQPTIGDTLRYVVDVVNISSVAAEDVVFTLGDSVVDIGRIEPLDIAMVHVDVLIESGAPGSTISAQGVVTATGASAVTDDPATAEPDDPTETVLGGNPVGAPGAPALTVVSPLDGSRVGVPTDIVVTADLFDGASVASWEVVGVASGTGPLPSTLGTFDPTKLQNGLQVLRIEVTDTQGRVGVAEVALEVAGQMKLGAFDVAFVDAEWHASLTPISLVRSYSTLRKDEVGDFGHGWKLSMLDFEVATNGPVGDGGWTQVSCGSGGLVFADICTRSSKPHLAVVRWPDGHVEAFDFEPEPGNTFFAQLASAAWVPRPGATSTLEPVAGDTTVVHIGDGLLYSDLNATDVYDPRQFWLQDAGGMRYLLDVDQGLLESVDRNGNRTTYGPDGIVPERGIGVSFVRDGLGRIERMDLADGSSLQYGYDAAGDLVSVVDGVGDEVELQYDGEHRLVSYNDAGHAPVAVLSYDADGRLISQTDPLGVLVETRSNPIAYTSTTVGPDPRLTTVRQYDSSGMLIEKTQLFEGMARRFAWTRDQDHRVIRLEWPSGAATQLERDHRGRVTLREDPDGVVTEWTYDEWSNATEERVNGRVVGEWTYDAAGNLTESRGAGGQVLDQRTWTSFGALERWVDGDGRVIDLRYDANDILIGADVDGRPWEFDVDALGRIVGVTDPTGAHVETVLDSLGRTTEAIDANGHSERWEFDDRGLRVAHTDKLGARSTWVYDASGRMQSRTTRTGTTVTYTRDAAGRIARIDGADAYVSYTRDALGRPVSVQNASYFVEIRWTDDGEIGSVTSGPFGPSGGPTVTMDYEYSPASRLELTDTPFGHRRMNYDAEGRIRQLFDSVTGVTTTWSLGADGEPRRVDRSTGLVTEYEYTSALRLARLVTTAAGVILQDTNLERGPEGWIERVTDLDGTHTYDYDARGQLLSANHPASTGLPPETYAYDANGNRSAWVGHDPADIAYDEADALIQDSIYLYSHDAAGRLVARESRSTGEATAYSWNDFDQLVRIDHPDGSATTMAYDGLGRRVELEHQGMVTRFVYDGEVVRATFDGNDNFLTWRSTYGGYLLAEWDATTGTLRDAVLDHMGSVVAWHEVGASSSVPVVRDSFGRPLVLPIRPEPAALTWHDQDPTGLIFMGSRSFDPEAGRFLSEDPVLSPNRYVYARNNPLSFWDPDGRSAAPEYGAILTGPAAGASAGASLWLFKELVLPPVLPPVRGTPGGGDDLGDDDDDDDDDEYDEDCPDLWRQAEDICRRLIYGPFPINNSGISPKGITRRDAERLRGGRNQRSIRRCAMGFVPERCGGNPTGGN